MTNDQSTGTLSIDSEKREGGIIIFLNIRSEKREVEAFLTELKDLLGRDDFDIDTDMTLIRRKKQGDDQKYSTPYTLLELDYDMEDVVNRIKGVFYACLSITLRRK